MKTLALVAIAVLHAAGWWNNVPEQHRDQLTRAATGRAVIAVPATPALDTTSFEALPVAGAGQTNLTFGAGSALALDGGTGTVLYAKDAGTRRPIASLTKIATALVILSRHELDDPITVPQLPAYGPDDERIGLRTGEVYSVQDLLRSLLIQSANDAADALAIADAGSQTKFEALMNAKMHDWGITDVHFTSPSGLTDAGNYASAEAMGKLARLLLVSPFLRQIVSEQSTTITSRSGRVIVLQSTNELLSSGNFYGIKTGYTLAAGECFVGLTRVNGHEVVTVVLGTSDRFGATQTLTNWITKNWQWL